MKEKHKVLNKILFKKLLFVTLKERNLFFLYIPLRFFYYIFYNYKWNTIKHINFCILYTDI